MILQICALVIIFLFYIFTNYDIKEFIRTNTLLLKMPPIVGKNWVCYVPMIGVTMDLAFLKPEGFVDYLRSVINPFIENNVPVVRTWLAGRPLALILDPNELDLIYGSTAHITKGAQYNIVKIWLKEGLLTSSGKKWHDRRKLLTPTFHFKILEDCLPTMNRNAKILASKLFETCGKGPIAPSHLIGLCTLDVISEAAMGVKLNAQNSESSGYVSDINNISEMIMMREMYFWLKPELIYRLTSTGRRFYEILNRLHSFTEKIIAERKNVYLKQKEDGTLKESKLKAFLDCLIDYEMKNPGTFSDLDMREEVDTFMFEGHDTTSMAILYGLMFIGLPESSAVQAKLAEEMYETFGDSDREVTYKDLQSMPYLELLIKEVLRMAPSVPLFVRTLTQDLKMKCGYLIPRGTDMLLSPAMFQQHEKFFPDPEKVIPERFLQENSQGRNPYIYTPFSAGPRNCIGQKFAMMELKTVLSSIIRKVKIETTTKFPEEVKYIPLLILRTKDPVYMKFSPRVYN